MHDLNMFILHVCYLRYWIAYYLHY